MKKNLFALTLAVVTTTATLATEPAADETKTVDAKASTVTWKAYKAVSYTHLTLPTILRV